MSSAVNTIDHSTLAHLVEAGAVQDADVIGHGGGWGVVVRFGMTERMLTAKRGSIRTFRKFETLVAYLKDLGILEYKVNAANFDPQALRSTRVRPDASQRMRSAFEAKAHADWMREKVAESLNDPQPNTTHKQVMDEVQALIESKRNRHAAKARS